MTNCTIIDSLDKSDAITYCSYDPVTIAINKARCTGNTMALVRLVMEGQ